MKNQLLFFFLLINLSLYGQFVTTWQTTAAFESITIPTHDSESYNYQVSWGDGAIEDGYVNDASHVYEVPGTYTVSIQGLFPMIYFADEGDKDKIISIDQWGNNEWESMNSAFAGCSNLAGQALDIPNLSNVVDMSKMFFRATSFNQDIGAWDVSNVQDVSTFFGLAENFNQDLSSWDVSNVVYMNSMFNGATTFNQDISEWDVGNVTTMYRTFAKSSFNQDIDNWDVSNVTDMRTMFWQNDTFNQDLNGWDVSNVTTMLGMFLNASSFNGMINEWDVGSVTNFSQMFDHATVFNQPLESWDVSSGLNMKNMFDHADVFNQEIGNWNVGNVTNMFGMFRHAYSFNQNIGDWNVSSVIDMEDMFRDASVFDQDIGDWNVGNVQKMRAMFLKTSVFNQDIGGWNVGNVLDMNSMFGLATLFNQDIGGWDVSKVTNMGRMFYHNYPFDQNIGSWNVSNVTTMVEMFEAVKLSTFNYDSLLIGWNDLELQSNVIFSGGLSQYCEGEDARENMIVTDLWAVTDQGQDTTCNLLLPSCVGLINPVPGSIDVLIDETIEWSSVNDATGYILNAGTSPNNYDLASNLDLGNVTNYNSFEFECGISVYVSITPYNDYGTAIGCQLDSFTIENVIPEIEESHFSECVGTAIQFFASGGSQYNWIPQDGLNNPQSPNPISDFDEDIIYTLTVSNDGHCPQDLTVSVERKVYENNLTFDIVGPDFICIDDISSYSSSLVGDYNYLWSKGQTRAQIDVVFVEPTLATISLSIVDSLLCQTGFVEREIEVSNCSIPNIFSPNNDGLNDFFPSNNLGQIHEIKIYNRFGQKIFDVENPNLGWDGKYKGTDAPIDIYIYSINYTGGKMIYGDISLVR